MSLIRGAFAYTKVTLFLLAPVEDRKIKILDGSFPLSFSSWQSLGQMGLVGSFGTNLHLTVLSFQINVSAGLRMVVLVYSLGPISSLFSAMYLFISYS